MKRLKWIIDGFAEMKQTVGKTEGKGRKGVVLHSDRKMERAMGAIRRQGDDGG